MVEKPNPGAQRSSSHSARDGAFWGVISMGAVTGVFAAMVAIRVGLVMLDRHMTLPTFAGDLRYYIETVLYSAVFPPLYVLIPAGWASCTVWWWLKRPTPRRHVPIAVLVLVGFDAVVAAWAWLATATRLIRSVYDVTALPANLGTSRITDADIVGLLIVAGLTCLIALVIVNGGLMVRETEGR